MSAKNVVVVGTNLLHSVLIRRAHALGEYNLKRAGD